MDENRDVGPESVIPLLAAFDAVAAEGHVTRAAERLGVPQSSVSRRLRSLERILGLALVQPVGRGVALTASGRGFFERTHRIVRELDEAVAAVRADADPDGGLVRFGLPLTLGSQAISRLLADFHVAAPRIRVHLVQAHGRALAAMLREGRLDVAVMIPPPSDLDTTILGSQQILLHVGLTHPFVSRNEVDLQELVDDAFVASPPSFHLRQMLDEWCADAGFSPRVPFEINEIDTVRALVGSGLGVALLPVAESPDPKIATVRLTGRRARDIALVTAPSRPTPAVARFHDHVVGSSFMRA